MSHISDIFLSFFRILIPLSILTISSIILVKLLKVTDLIEKLFYIFLFNWVQIILIIEFLSLFKLVKYLPVMILNIVILITVLIIGLLRKINFKIHFLQILKRFLIFYNNIELNRIIKILIIFWLIVIIGTTFFIGINMPPNNWDSMLYHLARVGFWQQNQSIDHYYTKFELQNEQPVNAEVGLLWIILFTNSDNLAFIIQWLSLIMIIIILYKLLRILNYNRIISFFTAFVFASLDIVILESSTTQNDLVVSCFIALSLYFIVRSLTDDKFNFLPIICAGITAGIAIGTKGYSYIFIPAFLIFIFLFNGKNKIKWLKTFYIIIFSLTGILLFAGHNLIQNYFDYGDYFLSSKSSDIFKITSPNIKALISNLSRHIASFWQFGDLGSLNIGKNIQHLLEIIHSKISIDISSPDFTHKNINFSLFYLPLDQNTSYFGPIAFFIIMPSVFFNFILFIRFKYFNKNNFYKVKDKYINSLLFFSIPVIFFFTYCYIFKWHPWAGRLFISMILIMMISFAEFQELLKNVSRKVLSVFIVIIFLFSVGTSCFSLFQNNNAILISRNNESIFGISNYNDRRSDGQVSEICKMVDQNLKEKSNLGLVLFNEDWIYPYFGKNFKRKLRYISDEEYFKNSYDGFFKDLDGILINSIFIQPRFDLAAGDSLLKVDHNNFKELFKPLNGCYFVIQKNGILVKVTNDDPYFETNFPFDFGANDYLIIGIDLESKVESYFKIYYGYKGIIYNEESSTESKIIPGNNKIYLEIPKAENIIKLRIDPINMKENILINQIEIYGPSKKINYKNIDSYYLFYK